MAKMQTLGDSFTTLDTSKWTASTPGDTSIVSGRLALKNTGNYPTYTSVASYDLTSSYAYVKVEAPLQDNSGSGAYFDLIIPDGTETYLRWAFDGGGWQIYAKQNNADVGSGGFYEYTAGVAKTIWVRFAHTSGTSVAYDTSPDGVTWTNKGTLTGIPFALTALKPRLLAYSNGGQTTVSYFDEFNGGTPASASYTGSIALSGSGTLARTGKPTPLFALALAGSGSLVLGGTPTTSASLPFTGTGSLTLAAALTGTGTLSLTGSGALTRSGRPALTGAVSLTSSGSLEMAGQPAVAASVALVGDGGLSLSGTALSSAAGTLALSGSGALSLMSYVTDLDHKYGSSVVALVASGLATLTEFTGIATLLTNGQTTATLVMTTGTVSLHTMD